MKRTLLDISDAIGTLLEDQADEITQAMTLADEEDPTVSISIGIKIDPGEWKAKISYTKEKRVIKTSGMVGTEPLPFTKPKLVE